eukprot:TRINITY_DN12592_c0_g1_i1.p1 TRINITY_DN12592_c0_g1~~TRINITY_DN12592_c0_g1_i1.p1  ORF type:complete len:212 (+),score=19.87 TRINITY_DN12592_c0_g1_i1:40-636(+)
MDVVGEGQTEGLAVAGAVTAAVAGGGKAPTRELLLVTPCDDEFQENPRVLAGKLLRKVKSAWPASVILASALHEHSSTAASSAYGADSAAPDASLNKMEGTEGWKRRKVGEEVADTSSDKFLEALLKIKALGLDDVWDKKPLVNGKDVITALSLSKRDTRTGFWMERAVEWQLAHPDCDVPLSCIEWLKMRAASGKET